MIIPRCFKNKNVGVMVEICVILVLISHFLGHSLAFVKSQCPRKFVNSTPLQAIRKSQTAIFDGAELVSILSVLYQEELETSLKAAERTRIPSSRAGYITFATGTPLNEADGNDRIIGICESKEGGSKELVQLDENVYIRKDSIAEIPNTISDADAISTATSALAGVRCTLPISLDESHDNKKVVVLGGGDFACFIAKALNTLGAQVTLVTTRPMSLKDTPLNPLRNTNGKLKEIYQYCLYWYNL